MTVYIDESFRRPVRMHLLANLVADVPMFPLILGVFGPPGEGKTYQVEKICAELGIQQHLLSPGELESENAGAPGQLLRRQYLAAGQSERGRRGVLVIHDIDTILGNWGDLVQYTVNRQVVYAQLMAFCDFPEEVAGNRCHRVPIIVTGNNPSILYGPLMRPGRMRVISWRPDVITRTKAVARLFPHVDQDSLASLVSRHPTQPISFWADVHATIIENRVESAVDAIGQARVKVLLVDGSRIRVPQDVHAADEVAAAAAYLAGSDARSDNYLERI